MRKMRMAAAFALALAALSAKQSTGYFGSGHDAGQRPAALTNAPD